jgi:hypothetical protein
MGKFLTSLLVLSASLLLRDVVFADEQVRRVQEELRKRHLFYADPTGEKGPALTLALKHYQAKKGFAPTGLIDSATLASLGLSADSPFAAITPAVVVKRGELYGANGEQLPTGAPRGCKDKGGDQMTAGIIGRDYVELELAEFARRSAQRRGPVGKEVRIAHSSAERDATFDATVAPPDRSFSGQPNPVWTTLGLQEEPDIASDLREEGANPSGQRHGRERRSHRRPAQLRLRKEHNPLVLTYRSIDRAMRSFFGDSHSKKKRSVTKRL